MTHEFPQTRDDVKRRFMVALDFDTADQAVALAERTRDSVGCFKIGLQLFVQEGPPVVRRIQALGADVFLDLKLHDIPNTISSAARRIADMGVTYFTVHCSNGARALAALKAELDAHGQRRGTAAPVILGVTVLTSLSDSDVAGLGFSKGAKGQVLLFVDQASGAGINGFVASPLEAKDIKERHPEVFLVTPGIRPAGAEVGDQARITTPADAIRSGADAIVVGRPVTGAADPVRADSAILEEMLAAFRLS